MCSCIKLALALPRSTCQTRQKQTHDNCSGKDSFFFWHLSFEVTCQKTPGQEESLIASQLSCAMGHCKGLRPVPPLAFLRKAREMGRYDQRIHWHSGWMQPMDRMTSHKRVTADERYPKSKCSRMFPKCLRHEGLLTECLRIRTS